MPLPPKIKTTTELKNVSISKINTFLECRRKYYWQYIRNLEPKNLPVPFFIGTCTHVGIEALWNGKSLEETVELVNNKMDDLCNQYIIITDEENKVEVLRSMILGMVVGYAKKHKQFRKKVKVIKTELEFNIPLSILGSTDLGISLHGFVDVVFEEKGKIIVGEHKTRSRIKNQEIDKLAMDMQVQCYPLAIKQLLNKRVHAVWFNMILKSRIRQKKNESIKELTERMIEEYVGNTDNYYFTAVVPASEKHREETMNDLVRIVEDIFIYHDSLGKNAANASEWPRNSNQCFNWDSPCPFFNLCRYCESPQHLMPFRERHKVD